MRMSPAQWSRRLVPIIALGGLLALPANAQQSGNQNSSSTQSSSKQTQQTPPAHKSAAQENPFPADTSQRAAQQQSQPDNNPPSAPDTPDAAQQPQSGQKPGDAAKENPFPEDVSKSAAAAAAKDNDSSSSGSGASSSSSNPGGDNNPDADLPPDTGRHRLKKPSDKDIQSGSLAGEGRAQEDVRIGRFYLSSRNYKGAYGRFSDAVRMDPANVDAIYGLASAADGLHNKDEALTNYKLYLQIAPDGDKAKSAQKAIRALAK